MRKIILPLCLAFTLISGSSAALAGSSKILTPEGWVPEPVWTEEEIKAPIAKKAVHKSAGTSSFFIRLQAFEEPHIHKDHDLTVVILEGRARLHYGDKAYELSKGDIQEIPRGTPHWVEKLGKKPVLAYAVFAPPLERQDYEPVKKP